MNNQNTELLVDDDEIDVLDLVRYLLRKWYLILVFLIAGACLLGFYTLQKEDTYTATASIFIQNDDTEDKSYSDYQLDNALSGDYEALATSKTVLSIAIEQVKSDTGIELTRKYINNAISVENQDDTRLLVFKATTENAELSQAIAEAVADATADQVSDIMNTERPKFVDHAEIEKPNSKGLIKHAAIGGAGGAFVICAVLVVLYLSNDMVVTEEDLKKYFDVNVLGTVSVDRSKNFKHKKNRKKK